MRGWLTVVLILLAGVAAGVGMAKLRGARYAWDGSTETVRQPTQQDVIEKLAQTSEGGEVEVAEMEYYFGTIKGADDEGKTHSHIFTIRNTGGGNLMLKTGTTTCQCTSLVVEPETVPPGGEAKVTVEWHVRNSSGHYVQTANVLTSDPERSMLAFQISGRVAGDLQVTPDSFQFPDAVGGESQEKEVKIVFFGTEREITDHSWMDPATAEYFQFRKEPLTEEELAVEREKESDIRNGYRLFVTLGGAHPNGAVRQNLDLVVEPAPLRPVGISITGQIRNELTLIGPNLRDGILPLAVMKQGQGCEVRNVRLLGNDIAHPVTVRVKETTPSFLKCEVGEPIPMPTLKNPEKYGIPLTLTVPKDAPQCEYFGATASQRATVTLETDHPSVPLMQFEVRFAITAE